MEIIIDHNDPFELEIKRCRLPIIIKGDCPVCGKPFKRNFNSDYFYYPMINEAFEVNFYHCDEETQEECQFTLELKLGITAELIDESI